jgi:hypothetical protein
MEQEYLRNMTQADIAGQIENGSGLITPDASLVPSLASMHSLIVQFSGPFDTAKMSDFCMKHDVHPLSYNGQRMQIDGTRTTWPALKALRDDPELRVKIRTVMSLSEHERPRVTARD